ncbi:MAG: hypothetical protein WCK90_01275 [archaeon]
MRKSSESELMVRLINQNGKITSVDYDVMRAVPIGDPMLLIGKDTTLDLDEEAWLAKETYNLHQANAYTAGASTIIHLNGKNRMTCPVQFYQAEYVSKSSRN